MGRTRMENRLLEGRFPLEPQFSAAGAQKAQRNVGTALPALTTEPPAVPLFDASKLSSVSDPARAAKKQSPQQTIDSFLKSRKIP